jgi:hypothetical protein
MKMMNAFSRLTIMGILVFFITSLSMTPDAMSGKGKGGRGRRQSHGRHKVLKLRDAKHRHALKRHHYWDKKNSSRAHRKKSKSRHHYAHRDYYHRHGRVHHGFRHHRAFGYFLYPGFVHRGYYPYRTQESVLAYKEDQRQYGLLKFDVQPPETEIFVNGQYIGKAEDLRDLARSVKLGGQQIHLKLGPDSEQYPIYVSPSSTTYFVKDLSSQGDQEAFIEDPSDRSEAIYACAPGVTDGLLRVSIQPQEADVFLNDGLLGKAEGLAEAGIVLPEGAHRIRIEAAGYQAHEATVEVRCGAPNELNVEMLRAS